MAIYCSTNKDTGTPTKIVSQDFVNDMLTIPWRHGVGDKIRELCKWKKSEYAEQFKLLRTIVAQPKYACMRCGRVADKKKYLCEPEPLKEK
jgi:hypothetical protein